MQPQHKKILLVALAGVFSAYLLFQLGSVLYEKTTKENVWAFIPADALAVLQVHQPQQARQHLDSTQIWQNLRTIAAFEPLVQRKNLMDTLQQEGIDFDDLLKDKNFTVSIHATTKGKFDLLFFLPVHLKDNTAFRSLVQNILSREPIKKEVRTYQGIEIQEVTFTKSQRLFTSCSYKNYFVGSFTGFLVEDAIRNLNELGRENFYTQNKAAIKTASQENLGYTLVFNTQKLQTFLQSFTKSGFENPFAPASQLLKNGKLQGELNNYSIVLSGEQPIDEKQDFLAYFEDTAPTDASTLLHFLSKRTAFLHRIGSDNLGKVIQKYQQNQLPNPSPLFTWQEFYEQLAGEVALATWEGTVTNPDKLLYVKVQNPIEMSRLWQEWANRLQPQGNFENFGNQKIVHLPIAELPTQLFGKSYSGFSQSYFIFANNYLVIGNSAKVLRLFLEDLENEQVWSKIYQQHALLEEFARPSHWAWTMNTLKAWKYLMAQLNPEWQAWFELYKRQWLRFELVNCQLQWQDDDKAMGFLQVFHQKKLQTTTPNQTLATPTVRNFYTTAFFNTLKTSPIIVKNATDKSKEVLVQDQAHYLHLLSVQGKKLWNFSVGSPITHQEVYQIDFLGKGTQELLFAAGNQVFLLDNKGQLVNGFPIKMPENTAIAHLALIDYDNTKNYRIAVADATGDLWLLSKTGQALQGWQPKKLVEKLAAPLRHIRAEGKDALVAIHSQGIVNVLKRNAESYAGFPVAMNEGLTPRYFVQQGVDFQHTLLHLLTTKGDLVKLDLYGKINHRETFERPNTFSIFNLLLDEAAQTDYLVSRQDEKKLNIFTKNNTLVFTKDYDNSSEKAVQYFNFGVNAELVAVTDFTAQKTYLYYLNGDSLLPNGLDSTQPVVIFFNEVRNEYLIYTVFENKVAAMRVGKW